LLDYLASLEQETETAETVEDSTPKPWLPTTDYRILITDYRILITDY
jgi:hypothetical protein